MEREKWRNLLFSPMICGEKSPRFSRGAKRVREEDLRESLQERRWFRYPHFSGPTTRRYAISLRRFRRRIPRTIYFESTAAVAQQPRHAIRHGPER